MTENLQMHLHAAEVEQEESEKKQNSTLDPRVFSSILISTKVQCEEFSAAKDPHARLLELMHSTPVAALLQSAEILAKKSGLTSQEALQQIIISFKEIDHLWNQVLIKEGIARLSTQYH